MSTWRVGALLLVGLLQLAACSDSPDKSDADSEPEPSSEPTSAVQMVNVGGYQLAYECEGEGSPTLLLESGSGSDRNALRGVLQLQGFRVCAYDRAGIGDSEQRLGSDATTVADRADELARLIEGAGIETPVVLVSHSLGGGIHQFFADRHPDQVAGMVFIDSVVIPAYVEFTGDELSDGTGGPIDMRRSAAELEEIGEFGSIPMVVLTQGFADDPAPGAFRKEFRKGHDELAGRSSNSLHVLAPEAGHMIQEQFPDLVIAAITEVVEAVRSDEPLAPCDRRFGRFGGACT